MGQPISVLRFRLVGRVVLADDSESGRRPRHPRPRFGSTPLGWARYFGQPPLIDLVEPLTAPGPEGQGG